MKTSATGVQGFWRALFNGKKKEKRWPWCSSILCPAATICVWSFGGE